MKTYIGTKVVKAEKLTVEEITVKIGAGKLKANRAVLEVLENDNDHVSSLNVRDEVSDLIGDNVINIAPQIGLKTINGVYPGWAPSNIEQLADNWQIKSNN